MFCRLPSAKRIYTIPKGVNCVKKTICLLLVLLLVTAVFSACGGEEPAAAGPLYAERGDAQRAALGNLSPAADANTVLTALAAAGASASAALEPGRDASDASGARLVVSGDAAGDPTVTDGSSIYMLDGYGVVTVSAAGSASKVLAYTKVDRGGEGWNERLYLWQDQLAVLWTNFVFDADGGWQGDMETRIVILSVADPAAPKQLSALSVDGGLVEACLVDGTLCVVTQKTLLTLPAAEQADTILPRLHENGKTFTLRPGEIYLSPEPANAALTVAAAIRLEDGRFVDALAFTDGTEAVCADCHDLYLARTRWDESASAPRKDGGYTVVDYATSAQTEIKRLKLDNSGLTLADGCILNGALSDAGAMDVWNGQLRVAADVDERSFSVYTDEAHGWSNREETGRVLESQLVLLDAELNVVGALARLGGEDGVTDCGFLHGNAWMTAKDTLAAVDLSKPAEPKVCGSFAAAGETLILRALGGNCVVAFSIPAQGGKLRLTAYDLSDPANPKQLDSKELDALPAGDLGARGALFADPASGLIGWPAAGKDRTEYRLVRWTGSKFEDKGSLVPDYVPSDARGLLLNGCLYLCNPAQVSVTDPEGMKVLATVSNAVG